MTDDQVRLIESRDNQTFKDWLKLHDSKGVKKQGKFLVSGRKLVPELLRTCPERFSALIREVGHPLNTSEMPVYALTKSLFNELDLLGTGSPILLGSFPETQQWTQSVEGPKVGLALQDPGNLGAALRACVGFGIENVILFEEACHPFHMKALKAGSGAQFELKLWRAPSVGDHTQLKNIIGLDMEGESLAGFRWPEDFTLVLGEEGQGLPDNINKRVKIPMSGKIESLNATTSLAIALYERARQR